MQYDKVRLKATPTMNPIAIPDSPRRWDCLCLGEVMLRLDPGEAASTPRATSRSGRAAANTTSPAAFDAASASAPPSPPRSPITPSAAWSKTSSSRAASITSLIKWVPYDGVGRTVRNGLNFTERGFGVRAAAGCSDRGNTAISQLKPGDFDWPTIFGPENGTKWFHTGGIFAALSASTADVAAEAMDAARATPLSSPTTSTTAIPSGNPSAAKPKRRK